MHRRSRHAVVASSAALLIALVGCAPTAPPASIDDEPVADEQVESSASETPAAPGPTDAECRDTVLYSGYVGDLGSDGVENWLHPEFLPDGALERAGCLMDSSSVSSSATFQTLWFFGADLELYEELRDAAEDAGLEPVSWQDTDQSGYTWSAAEIWDKPTDPADWDGFRYDYLSANREVDREYIRDWQWEGSFLTYLSDVHELADPAGYVRDFGPVIILGWIGPNA